LDFKQGSFFTFAFRRFAPGVKRFLGQMFFERNDHRQATHELKIGFRLAVLSFQLAEEFSVAVVSSD
jgi:hypothetical protein